MNDQYTKAESALSEKETRTGVRPPFGYYGAKQRLSGRIVNMLPPHNAWVEGFCGSAAITLAKEPAPIEVINDLDGRIVNLFEQLRNNTEALCKAVALTPYAISEFEQAKSVDAEISGLEDARQFLVTTMMTVNGTVDPRKNRAGFSYSQSYTRRGREARVSRWCNLPERIERVVERLRRVRVENRDARDLMSMFSDRPATLAYLDPPYFTKREHRYVIDAIDEEFHEDLLRTLVGCKCMVILSGYDNPLYQRLLVREAGWTKHKINTATRDTKGVNYERSEILWTNPRFDHAQKLGRVPIRLSKKEKANKKVNPERKHS